MPTYQYRCAACQNQFDAFQRFADDPLTDCPSCDGTVRRVIQPVGVVFKGSGWYINDSRKKSDSDSSPDPSTKKTDKVDKSETSDKSDASKPAATATESSTTETKVAASKTEAKPAAAAAD